MLKKAISLLALILFTNLVGANTLWRDNGFGSRLFVDHRARSLGDAITVILEESTAAKQQANTKLDNKSDLSVGPGTGLLAFGNDKTVANGVTESDSFQGKGATDRSSSLQGMITAQVIEILPNGEYKIKGRKETLINDETQIIEITGIVRPEHISLDNTIKSSYISNARIAYLGAGPVGDSQAPGIVTKMFGWLF